VTDPARIRFVRYLHSRGGYEHAAGRYTLAEMAEANGFLLTPGVSRSDAIALVSLSFLLAPADPAAIIPRPDHEPLHLAAFGLGLLGDCKQAGNPVRSRLGQVGVDPFEGADLWHHPDVVADIVKGVAVEYDPEREPVDAPRSIPEFWSESWEDEVASAMKEWRGERPIRIATFTVWVEPRWATHAIIPLGVAGTRAHLPGS
jgi:hypothetical protein